MKEKICCFIGDRRIAEKNIPKIEKCLNQEIDNLIKKGVTNFISSGALGFEQLAASVIINKKQRNRDIRLIFILPYYEQDKYWTMKQVMFYNGLLRVADEVGYITEVYNIGCNKKQNIKMLQSAGYCIAFSKGICFKSAQAFRMAKREGLNIIDIEK